MEPNPVAIVTAAGKGIGGGIARHLAGAGYRLVLQSNGSGAETLANQLGCIGLRGSVTDPTDLERAVQAAVSAFGRIDLVVNNTGHPAQGKLLEIPDSAWHEGLDLLLLNVARMARAVVPVMEAQGGGAIVNISTYAAEQPSLQFPVSSALRAALSAYVKLFADACGPVNIRMNNILPGSMENYPADEARLAAIPLRRQGTMDDLGALVAFLATDAAAYLTGQNIRFDGGLTRAI